MDSWTVFVDLDGVLADFEVGVQKVCGAAPHALFPPVMWKKLASQEDFYGNLPWIDDGKLLWDFVKPFDPIILTGLPIGKWAEPQKRRWCARELSAQQIVITCLSRNKHTAAQDFIRPGTRALLIDDREKLQAAWEAAGGVFILHRSAGETIAQLRAIGFQASGM